MLYRGLIMRRCLPASVKVFFTQSTDSSLMSLRNILTDTARNTVYHLPGHPLAHSSYINHLMERWFSWKWQNCQPITILRHRESSQWTAG
jgi:hypothetical protein